MNQRHRGESPEDPKIFAEKWIPILHQAVHDLSWLLTQEYPPTPSLQLVGNRYRLTDRQMMAVMRCACSMQAQQKRVRGMMQASEMAGEAVAIDGYNLLITLESVLSGGVVLLGRDGCYRDLASIHKTYKSVEETLPALHLIGEALQEIGIKNAVWYFDKPVSNSGRLKLLLQDLATEKGWDWQAELAYNPDKELIALPQVVITSDSWILDECGRWFNLLDFIIKNKIESINLKNLS